MKELKKYSQISVRTKTQETKKNPVTAHQKVKRASLDGTVAKHNRRGYENRKLYALGYPNPRQLVKAKRQVKLLSQIMKHREKKANDKSNPDN